MRKETFRIIKNAAFLLFEKGASRLVSVFFLAALGRVLGEAPLGQYVSVLALVSIAEAVSALGTQRILVRNISQDPEQGSRYFSNATTFLFLFGLAFWVILILLARLLGYSRDMLVLLAIAGASIPFSTVSGSSRAVLKACERMEIFSLVGALSQVIAMGTGAILILLGAGVRAAAATYFAASALEAVAIFIIVHVKFARFRITFEMNLMKLLLRDSIPAAVLSCLVLLLQRSDIIVLSRTVVSTEVGLYGAATRVVNLLAVFRMSALVALFPLMSRLLASDRKALQEVFEKTTSGFLILTLPAVALLNLFPSETLTLIFGRRFLAGAFPARLLSWAYLVATLSAPGFSLIIIENKRMLRASAFMFALACAHILAVYMVARAYGSQYAAVVTLASSILVSALLLGYASRILGRFPFRVSRAAVPVLSCALSVFVALLASLFSRWAGFFVLVPAYLVLLAAFQRRWKKELFTPQPRSDLLKSIGSEESSE